MIKRYWLIILLFLACTYGRAQWVDSVLLQVSATDTFYLARMQDVYVYPKMVFKNKKQEQFYWRTVRDVKKTLPFAKLLAKEMQVADCQLAQLPDEKERRKWWRQHEKLLFKKYEHHFTVSVAPGNSHSVCHADALQFFPTVCSMSTQPRLTQNSMRL